MKIKICRNVQHCQNIFLAREEEVPDPAAPAEGEYAEYTEEQQYAVSQTLKQ